LSKKSKSFNPNEEPFTNDSIANLSACGK
jgi:hypothetical protein